MDDETKTPPTKQIPKNRVGMPAAMYLDEFGSQVWAAFDSLPFLVGSATRGRDWNDVDVRLILEDSEYEALKLGDPHFPNMNGKWISLCLAYSELGKKITGLPIDFQIQQMTYANKKFPSNCGRIPIGMIPLRIRRNGDDEHPKERPST